MQKRKGISLMNVIVLLVVVCIAYFLFLHTFSMPCPDGIPSDEDYCAMNLNGIYNALMTYGLDYDDDYPVIGGAETPWSKNLGWNYDYSSANYFPGGAENGAPRSITASWYLLVREADVDPYAFICKGTSQVPYENTIGKDLYELWDFGPDPHKHVSYAMQNPFGKFPASGASNPGAAIVADMSPWFKNGDIVPPASGTGSLYPVANTGLRADRLGNSLNHEGEGQNVLFGDGHVEFHRTANVGVDNDNIYTYWSNETDPAADDKQIGINPTARDKDNDSKDAADSFLAI